ncbi:Hypothetical protein NTJ_11404 [Nesidiocoris tenuis]|uniref:SWI/SNF-related matrix-associated actin-dependent regulator of chromatin subfamily A containing DEAD/H box 1 n=1 Tax=Nesidiocoris tenuis TaxID=355587 RepID=A0ABN7B2E9_9HEMI|nr:Hypothetical protein NTJ_11404 [Nesidiocoris tenuis]
MISTTQDKSKIAEHLKKFRYEKKKNETEGSPRKNPAKKPEHDLSDSENSSRSAPPSKSSSPSSSKNNSPSKSSTSSRGSHSSPKAKHDSRSSKKDGKPIHHSMSESENGESNSSQPVKTSRIANRDQMDNSSDDDEPKRTFSRIKTFSEKSKRKRIQPPSSGSESNSSRSSSSDRSRLGDRKTKKRRKLKRDRRSPVIFIKKKKPVVDQDEKRWSDTVLVDSDEEESLGSNKMTFTKTQVFNFMNSATIDDLVTVPSITLKRAEAIIEQRPFSKWLDMIVKLKFEKYLGTEVLDNVLETLKAKDVVSRLMNKCLDIALSTEKAILDGGTTLTSQPAILTETMQLKSYQMVGLNWLIVMHKQKLNGILADEMGLGKTIQVVSFLAYLREVGITDGPHLIVCPTSTIDNWAIEFTRWCPNIRVVIYHGAQDERKRMRSRWFKEKFSSMDVIVTSYQIVGSNAEERKMFRIMPLEYVVFDEAHMLKNMNTARYGHLFSINAKYRLLLTGTPLQNNLLELMSLLNFVMPNMFSSKIEYIKNFFAKKPKNSTQKSADFEQEQLDLAKRIMKPFVMRRLKQDVLKDLPKKTNVVLKVPMEKGQKIRYDDFLEELREIARNPSPDNPANFMSSFMQLRKLSNHPLTLRYNYKESTLKEMASRLATDYGYKETNEQHIFEDLCYSSDHEIHKLTQEYKCVAKFKLDDSLFRQSGKFLQLDELLPKLKEEGHRVVMFSQFVFMLDIIEEYLRIHNYEFMRLDGSTSMGDRQELIDDFNDCDEIFVFLLTTRAGGVGINLTSADTVIIHDVDFNPYNDKQAEDRCHRLGQSRPVKIFRLISEGTVEEKIYAMAQSKLDLEQELIGKEDETEETKKVESLLAEVLGSLKK